ncbi:Uncharacterised protein [Chryseobacterium nakagawai]|uniref:Uncharacterized protein n=1 Tax=Chryseobacterium nakagawai TaxID=1241982 RepID=A0AAD1DN68_CHRNA|nr:hypothetical protein [Chryseobacterium nakagawai]AZA89297.1 hypothetical protein EG343_00965 [Chryseobacterium nakagawai]VEH20640.1 Uncharacterised protein [Chryseobacterium nakagawai]
MQQSIQVRKNNLIRKSMKKIILITLIFFFTFNKSAIRKQDLHNIIKGYIEYISKKRKVNPKNGILVLAFHDETKEKGEYSVDIAFFDPKVMKNMKYNHVYTFEGYKLILPDNECKAIQKMFKKISYENFNQAEIEVDYEVESWHIVFNKIDEINFLSPSVISGCMKSILKSKNLKFSDTYKDVSYSSPDCSKFTPAKQSP